MMLPQLLESGLVREEGSEEAGQLVADWIDKVRAWGVGGGGGRVAS
jgi:hypothetical protein